MIEPAERRRQVDADGPAARPAVEAGADLLGFNFYRGSVRYIEPEMARSIVVQIRSGGRCPTLVGVFVNSPLDEVRAIVQTVDLNLAQLHGDEPMEMIAQLAGCTRHEREPGSDDDLA